MKAGALAAIDPKAPDAVAAIREMLPHVARLRADFEFDVDPGVEIDTIEYALQRVLRGRKTVSPRCIGSCEDNGETGRTVLQIVQRLRIGDGCIRMVHPLHDRPRCPGGACGDGRRVARALVDRVDPQAVIGLADKLLERRAFQDAVGELPPVVTRGGREVGRKRQGVGFTGHSEG